MMTSDSSLERVMQPVSGWYRVGESTIFRRKGGSVSKGPLPLASGLDFDLGSEGHPMQYVDARAVYLFC
jgi:hypothetical protein